MHGGRQPLSDSYPDVIVSDRVHSAHTSLRPIGVVHRCVPYAFLFMFAMFGLSLDHLWRHVRVISLEWTLSIRNQQRTLCTKRSHFVLTPVR